MKWKNEEDNKDYLRKDKEVEITFNNQEENNIMILNNFMEKNLNSDQEDHQNKIIEVVQGVAHKKIIEAIVINNNNNNHKQEF